MKTMQKFSIGTIAAMMMLGLSACGGMSTRDKDTAIGAGAGAVVGGVLTDSKAGAIGGAVVGGGIGNEVGKDKK